MKDVLRLGRTDRGTKTRNVLAILLQPQRFNRFMFAGSCSCATSPVEERGRKEEGEVRKRCGLNRKPNLKPCFGGQIVGRGVRRCGRPSRTYLRPSCQRGRASAYLREAGAARRHLRTRETTLEGRSENEVERGACGW